MCSPVSGGNSISCMVSQLLTNRSILLRLFCQQKTQDCCCFRMYCYFHHQIFQLLFFYQTQTTRLLFFTNTFSLKTWKIDLLLFIGQCFKHNCIQTLRSVFLFLQTLRLCHWVSSPWRLSVKIHTHTYGTEINLFSCSQFCTHSGPQSCRGWARGRGNSSDHEKYHFLR